MYPISVYLFGVNLVLLLYFSVRLSYSKN